ncbi:MAG: RagB/SusD family nutrient uptake outer membrane protein [Saprospiraceae bacterium]|nr:RagB/SusD family nutrient uptake outer membrane protein [Saprospiraceae bacterium]
MKKLKYILFSGILLLAGACDKNLDIEPLQSVSENVALDSDANVKLVLQGAYDNLSKDGMYGGNLFRDAELLGSDGEVRWVGTYSDPRDIFNHDMDAGNSDVENTWAIAYQTINSCNNVLSALDIVNAEDRDRVEGEAKFIRGVCYFELVRLFSRPFEEAGSGGHLAVPVITTPTRGVTENSYVVRNSIDEVYDQVLSDLLRAIEVLPEDNGVNVSKYAAVGMAARVNMMLRNYEEAHSLAVAVIASGNYSLVSNYSDLWNQDDDTDEALFSIQVSALDGVNELVTFFSIPEFGGRDGDIEIQSSHLALYDPTDTRLALFYDGNGAMRTGKWKNQYKNIPIIRLAEMYLIAAECEAHLFGNGAVYLNPVRERAGLAPVNQAFAADVVMERRRELAFEGHKIHDIKRVRGTVDGLNYDAPELVFPIPAREIEVNRNLEQNDGY